MWSAMVDEESNERDFALSLEMKDRLLFWRQFTHSEQVCLCLSFSLRISICLSFFLYRSLSISVYMSLSLSLSLRWPDRSILSLFSEICSFIAKN